MARLARLARLAAATALMGLVAACTTSTPPAPRPSPGPLVLGTLLPVTGDMAHLGPPEQAAVKLAVHDINAAGGVLGQPVTVLDGDSGDAYSNLASQAVDRQLEQGVDAIVGGTGSAVTLGVVDKVVGAGVLEISPGDASGKLTGYPDRGLYFRLVPPDTFDAQVLSDALRAAGHRTVSVLAVRDNYASTFLAAFTEDFDRAGGRVLSSVEYDGQATDLSGPAQQMAGAAADANVVIGSGEVRSIIKALIAISSGPDVTPLYLSDLALSNTVTAGLPPARLVGIRGVRPGGPLAAGFVARLAALAPDLADYGYAAQTYDAVLLVALAAESARSTRGRDLAAALPGVTTGGATCSAYADCLALIKAGRTVAYAGQAGAVPLTPQGEPTAGAAGVYAYRLDGTYGPEAQSYTDWRSGAAVPTAGP